MSSKVIFPQSQQIVFNLNHHFRQLQHASHDKEGKASNVLMNYRRIVEFKHRTKFNLNYHTKNSNEEP